LFRFNRLILWKETTHEIRFFVRIRGARTPPPKIDAPVTKIPLRH
jgi:hypothetical protein